MAQIPSRYGYRRGGFPTIGPELIPAVVILVLCLLAGGLAMYFMPSKSKKKLTQSAPSSHHRHVCILVLLDHGTTYSSKFAGLLHQAQLDNGYGRAAFVTNLQKAINVDDILESTVLFSDPIESQSVACEEALTLEQALAELVKNSQDSDDSGEASCILGLVSVFPSLSAESMPNTVFAALSRVGEHAAMETAAVGAFYGPEPGGKLSIDDGTTLFQTAKEMAKHGGAAVV